MAFAKFQSIIYAPVTDVFAFYNDINNLKRISPPGFKVEILHVSGHPKTGTRIELSIKKLLITLHWTVLITDFKANQYFVDFQEKGPFAKWIHRHEFHLHEEGTELIDVLEYELPLYPISWPLQKFIVLPQFKKMFKYRHEKTREYLEKKAAF